MLRPAVPVLVAAALLAATSSVRAQIPDTFKNLKVLPKKITKDELTQTMRGYAISLGVRCQYCHVPKQGVQEEPGRLALDFASDERPTKGTARKMIKMVGDLNDKYLSKLDPKAKIKVECVTCHHGVARPEPLAALMRRTVADSGATVATARYEALRAQYYGSASYDFTEASLNSAAEGLLKDGKAADAVALLELNAKHNDPPGSFTEAMLGDAYAANGDKDKARAAYQKALEIMPNNQHARKALEALDTGQKP
jgi:hypothetical protein